jgi:electron transfer flavoprotein alpha/beta subunit
VRPADEPGGLALAVRADSAGGFRAVSTRLPAVISVAADSSQPRYAPAASIIRVYAEPEAVEPVTPGELGLEAAELAPLVVKRGESFPPERQTGQPQPAAPGEAARQLSAELQRQEAGERWI